MWLAWVFFTVAGLPADVAELGLIQFWEKHRALFPAHPIHQQYLDMNKVIPYYLHGDGGRGFKKDPIEILSMFPALGAGTCKRPVPLDESKRKYHDEGPVEMGVNLVGSSGTTRFLFCSQQPGGQNRQSGVRLLNQLLGPTTASPFGGWFRSSRQCLAHGHSGFYRRFSLHQKSCQPHSQFQQCEETSHVEGGSERMLLALQSRVPNGYGGLPV